MKKELRLEKSFRKEIGIFALFFLILYLFVYILMLIKNNISIYRIFYYLFLLDANNVPVWFFFCITVIMFLGYKLMLLEEKRFLEKGIRYDAEIIDVIHYISAYGRSRSSRYKIVVKYGDNKTFTSLPYISNPNVMLKDFKCSVYELNGKCYLYDFNIRESNEFGHTVFESDKYEVCLIGDIDKKVTRKEFMSKRVSLWLGESSNYILPVPLPKLFADGVSMAIAVDIKINSTKKVKVFTNFTKELNKFIIDNGNDIESTECHVFLESVEQKVYELMHTYYYFVELVYVKVAAV